jgi:hypothetical protein
MDMKKIKLVVMLLIVALILVFAFQNQTYFQEKQQLGLSLPLMDPYSTPEVSTAAICLICFFLGFLFSFMMSISGRMKRKRTIKSLNLSVKKREKEIETLKKEIKEAVPEPKPEELVETSDSPPADKQEAPATT